MTIPQSKVIVDRNVRGPIFRMAMVAGNWTTMYGAKKTSRVID
jgi:hypothetical protein